MEISTSTSRASLVEEALLQGNFSLAKQYFIEGLDSSYPLAFLQSLAPSQYAHASFWEWVVGVCCERSDVDAVEVLITQEVLRADHYTGFIEKEKGFIPLDEDMRSLLLDRLVEESDLPSEDCLALCRAVKAFSENGLRADARIEAESLLKRVRDYMDITYDYDCVYLRGAIRYWNFNSQVEDMGFNCDLINAGQQGAITIGF